MQRMISQHMYCQCSVNLAKPGRNLRRTHVYLIQISVAGTVEQVELVITRAVLFVRCELQKYAPLVDECRQIINPRWTDAWTSSSLNEIEDNILDITSVTSL